MNILKPVLVILLLLMGMAFNISSLAQTSTNQNKVDLAQPALMTDGEVRKIDREASKVTIKHGNIKHLDMPGMTMVFTVKEKNLLDNIKLGDKIKFMVINDGGKMIVTDIQPTH